MHALHKRIELTTRCYFGGGPTPPKPPKPPAPMEAASLVNAAINAQKKKGFNTTFLSGPGGVTNQTSKKTLLGE